MRPSSTQIRIGFPGFKVALGWAILTKDYGWPGLFSMKGLYIPRENILKVDRIRGAKRSLLSIHYRTGQNTDQITLPEELLSVDPSLAVSTTLSTRQYFFQVLRMALSPTRLVFGVVLWTGPLAMTVGRAWIRTFRNLGARAQAGKFSLGDGCPYECTYGWTKVMTDFGTYLLYPVLITLFSASFYITFRRKRVEPLEKRLAFYELLTVFAMALFFMVHFIVTSPHSLGHIFAYFSNIFPSESHVRNLQNIGKF